MRPDRICSSPEFIYLVHSMLTLFLGGHYTAYCLNPVNGKWYEFDDQYVTEVQENVVAGAEAYVLFYR